MDMSPTYRRGIGEHLPDAHLTFDRFHVVKLLKDAVYKVRRAERKEAPELKRTRYLWPKNEHSLSGSRQRLRTQLPYSRRHLKTVRATSSSSLPRTSRACPPTRPPVSQGLVRLGQEMRHRAHGAFRSNFGGPRSRISLHPKARRHHLPHARQTPKHPAHLKQRGAVSCP